MKNTLFLLLTIVITISSCKQAQKEVAIVNDSTQLSVSLKKENLIRMEVETGTTCKGTISSIVRGTGAIMVAPNSEAFISLAIPAKIDRIHVTEGSYVKKGQPIFSVSSFQLIELQQNYLMAKNEANFYKLEYDRQKELKLKNVGALADFQSTESKYYNAISTRESLGEKLKLIGINPANLVEDKEKLILSTIDVLSPIDGYLFELHVTLGQRIDSEFELAHIIDLNSMYGEVNVFEKDIDLIEENQEVLIDFVNDNMPQVKGSVNTIAKSIDPISKSIKVYVRLNKSASSKILPGMSVKADIKVTKNGGNNNYLVPVSGLLQEGELYYIFRIINESETDFTFKKTKVMLKKNDGNFAEISLLEQAQDSFLIITKHVELVNNEVGEKFED